MRLYPPVDSRPEHALGEVGAEVTLVEYGSFGCPSCHAAHEVIARLRERFGGRVRYVFRHRPLTGSAAARRAAELAEYAAETSGEYWRAHEALMRRGPTLQPGDVPAVAAELGLPPREAQPEAWRAAEAAVQQDLDSARESDARVSPTFFINGRRYDGPWDETTLAEAMLGSLGHRVQTAMLDFARWAPSTGLLLLAMTLAAIAWVNFFPFYETFWQQPLGLSAGGRAFSLPLRDWINDGLLTVFFLVVGLEIKREFTVGRLASRRAAALPVAAAAGGMALPALLYLALAPASLAAGWAIPTTTDTAFAVALIALLGRRVPVELRIFLTAAVIVDDLVAIAVVALFYSGGLDWSYVAASGAIVLSLVFLNNNGVYRALPYALLGVLLWACLHASGLHATLAGVILAVVTPTRPPPNLRALAAQAEILIEHELRRAGEHPGVHRPSEPTLRSLDAIHDRMESPAAKLLRGVEPWSSYLVLPLFALANAGLSFTKVPVENHDLILAVILGLVVGKPLGMFLAALAAARLGLAAKPEAYSWTQLLGAGALAGIGFTMSLYIAHRAFPGAGDFAAAKLGVFAASLLAGAAGTAILWAVAKKNGNEGG
ncbi:MAG: Na+/H+ antiporter NhaA [Betaproteobacteria bacterium]